MVKLRAVPDPLPDHIRIEAGPVRKTATATPALLTSGRLASHYKPGAPDALAQTIEMGKEFAYLDWKGMFVWKVYKREGGRFLPLAEFETEDEAHEYARNL